MLIQILGPVQVMRQPERGSGAMEVVPVARPARRRLLSLLALRGGEPVPIDRIAEEFWPTDRPARARAVLHTHVSALRRALSPDLVRTDGDAYRLDLTEHELDTAAFDAGARDALAQVAVGSWARAVETAGATLALWRGDPYVELPDHHDAVVETARLSELRRTLRQVHAEGLLNEGRTAEAVAELEQLVLEYPLHEQLWEHLMSGRIQLGHHATALRVYHRARAALADLGLDTGPTLRMLQTTALRRQDELRRPPDGLPVSLTRFLGRGAELAELGSRLGDHRLVTVTGVGGVGKTRTAVEAARRERDRFPGGIWFVPLADVGPGESVANMVARVLGLRGRGDIAAALRRRLVGGPALVVLDNCEHLHGAVSPVVRDLLLGCPEVHVLATSREPLRLAGEVVYDLPPMAVPRVGAPVEALAGYDAVQLFLERAQVDPKEREPGVMSAAAEVCRRLDGIPLALGLAAAEVRGRGVAGVLSRLAADLGSVADDAGTAVPRHRTLDAVVDWSYATLDEQERAVLRRLAVFRGSFAPDAAEAIASDGGVPATEVLPVLGRLVEKSLVTRSGHTTVRYQLLEVVRQYADRRLRTCGEHLAVADRHARWYAELAWRMWRGVHDRSARPEGTSPLVELANLREARQHLEARGHRDIALLSGAIAHGAAIAGLVGEALAETRRALAEVGGEPEWEVDMHNRLAHLLFLLDDREGSHAQSSRACEMARTLPPSGIVAWTYAHHGHLGLYRGSPDHTPALRLTREALAVAVASGDPLAQTRCRGRLGHTLAWVGRGDEGLAELRAAVEAARRARDPLTEIELAEALFQALRLTRTQRRDGPATLAGDLHERFLVRRSPLAIHLPLPSLVHAFLQSGRWESAREVLEVMDDHHHEGDDHVATAVARAAMSWVLGRHDDAAATLRQLTGELVAPHWYDRCYPLRVEVAADTGDLDEGRRVAEEYLGRDVGSAQQSGKLGAVSALVRVEAMAAAGEPAAAEEHADRARAAVALGEELLARFPPPHGGSLAMETPATHLALARAELTRLTGADPHAWEVARASVDHVRYRLYAGLRLAEALLRVGDMAAARREAAVVLARSGRIGARGLQQGAARLLTAGPAHAPAPSPGGRPAANPPARAW